MTGYFSRAVPRGVARLTVGALIVAAIMLVIRPGVTEPFDPVLPDRTDSPQYRPLVKRLSGRGIDVTDGEREALRALLRRWSARPDLQAISSEPDGSVNLPNLLSWALTTRDGDLQLIAAWQPELQSLRWHLGLVAEGESVTLPLLAQVRNGRRELSPDADFDAAVLEAGLVVDERPDVRMQMVQNGRLDSWKVIQWAYDVPFNDPAFGRLYPRRDAYRSLLCRHAGRRNCTGFA